MESYSANVANRIHEDSIKRIMFIKTFTQITRNLCSIKNDSNWSNSAISLLLNFIVPLLLKAYFLLNNKICSFPLLNIHLKQYTRKVCLRWCFCHKLNKYLHNVQSYSIAFKVQRSNIRADKRKVMLCTFFTTIRCVPNN